MKNMYNVPFFFLFFFCQLVLLYFKPALPFFWGGDIFLGHRVVFFFVGTLLPKGEKVGSKEAYSSRSI